MSDATEKSCSNKLIDLIAAQRARIEQLEYALSIIMCVHDDAKEMTGYQR